MTLTAEPAQTAAGADRSPAASPRSSARSSTSQFPPEHLPEIYNALELDLSRTVSTGDDGATRRQRRR